MEAMEKIEVARENIETAQGTLQIVDTALEKAEDVAFDVVRTRSKFRSFVRFMLFVAVVLGIAMAIRAILESRSSSGAPEASFEPAPTTPEPVVDEVVDDAPSADEDSDDESPADGDEDAEDDSEESPADES